MEIRGRLAALTGADLFPQTRFGVQVGSGGALPPFPHPHQIYAIGSDRTPDTPLNAAGRYNPRIPDDTITLVRELGRLMPDRQIARLLNRSGVETGHGNAWTLERVRGFRKH